ncbi:Sec23-binding domain of Sec16-domain-containing protein [Circinella umbellata]|nr:Sec23-binding domain of Sec16-domain-containing protein [Circinella umbellata]
MCVMFPQTVQRFTAGHDSAITKAMPSAVQISKLKDVIGDQNPTVASLAQFVGPVLNDPKGSTKNKKKEVLTYMDKRIEELTAALQQQTNTNNLGEYHQAENRISLWRLLKTLIENDGTIGDGDKMDNAVRALLQPIKKGEENDQGNFSVPAYAQADGQQQDEDAENRERSKKVLNKLESYLVDGDRAGAVEYAMQEDLWAHALILSSCVNKDVWKKVVTNFVERELSQSAGETPRQDRFNVTGDKQALRVLYSLFAGSGASSMTEFLPAAAPQQRLGTPFGVPAQAAPLQATEEQLQEWQITLTLILANRTPRDTEAITSLGDILRTHGWLDAAHICYLVSPQSSLHSGIDAPHVRLTLIGAEGTTAFSDLDAYYLTELYEFALSTKPGGASSLPFLQGYKLVHAWWLADFGYLNEAQRYCEAIADAIKGYTKGSPYLHRQLLENLKEFSELCEAASGQSIGDTKSWVKNKLSKNMLESMWGSFEGKFNKFVSGEDMPDEEPPVRKSTEIMGTPYDAAKDGPPARSASAFDFRNAARSSIGPESLRRAATPTANMPSEAYGNRRSSSPGVRGLQQTGPFAHAFTPLSHYGESQMQEQPQQEELSQTGAVMDEQQQQQQDAQDNHGYGQQGGYGGYGYGAQPSNATTSPFGYTGGAQQATNATTSPFGHGGSAEQQPQSYYGQGSYNNSPTPYGEQQPQQDQQNGYGGYDPNAGSGWYGGDQQQQQQPATYQPEQTSSYEPPVASSYEPGNQGDNDLGFGNSSLTKSKSPSIDITQEDQTQSTAPEPISQENPTDKPHEADEKKTDEGKHGWGLLSFFSRSSTPSNASQIEKKAVKANLGEESAFYYDEKEKRWVNKNAPATPAAPSLPPPPKATSSPAPTNRNTLSTPPPPPSSSSSTGGPPVSTASTPGQKQPLLMRSGSTPPTTTTPPARSATSPPPTAPPSGGARRSRKPMRSRYVDVFNQPGN